MNMAPGANRAGLLYIMQQQPGIREIQMDQDSIGDCPSSSLDVGTSF